MVRTSIRRGLPLCVPRAEDVVPARRDGSERQGPASATQLRDPGLLSRGAGPWALPAQRRGCIAGLGYPASGAQLVGGDCPTTLMVGPPSPVWRLRHEHQVASPEVGPRTSGHALASEFGFGFGFGFGERWRQRHRVSTPGRGPDGASPRPPQALVTRAATAWPSTIGGSTPRTAPRLERVTAAHAHT